MSRCHNVPLWLRQDTLRGVEQHVEFLLPEPLHTPVQSYAVQPQVQLLSFRGNKAWSCNDECAGLLQAAVAVAAAAAVREEVLQVCT